MASGNKKLYTVMLSIFAMVSFSSFLQNGQSISEYSTMNTSASEFPKIYFQDFLDFHDLSKDKFWQIANKWRNEKIWHKVNNKWKLKNELI